MPTNDWDAAYMADPDDEDLANLYANRMRAMKSDIHERGEIDLYWESASLGGKHKKSTYVQQASDPTVGANEIALYAKDDGSNCELYMKNETPVVRKLTEAGELVLDDHSADDAEQASATDPGDSDTQVNPTTMGGEVETLRYAIQRAGIGLRTQLSTAASAAGWFDGAVISDVNECENGAFLDNGDPSLGLATTLRGWTINGPPSTTEFLDLGSYPDEGEGTYLHLQDATGAITDGPSQTLSKLKANTRYLVVARILKTTGEVALKTTGADSGTFTNLDFDTGDIGGGLGTGWHTLSGIIETDSTPADIVVGVYPDVTNYNFGVLCIGVYEVITDYRSRERGGVTIYKTSANNNLGTAQNETRCSVGVPGPGYIIEVEGGVHTISTGSAGWTQVIIQEDVDGGGSPSWASVKSKYEVTPGGTWEAGCHIHYCVYPNSGSVYSYQLGATFLETSLSAGGGSEFHYMKVTLRKL